VVFRIELAEPAANRDVRADYEHDVRIARVRSIVDLVEDAPRRQHPHHRRLARPRGHLAGVAAEGLVAEFALLLVARLVERHVDTLQQIATGLVQEDDGFGSFALREERPEQSSIAPPVAQQFQRGRRDAWVARVAPLGETRAYEIDQRQRHRDARWRALVGRRSGWPIEVLRGASPGPWGGGRGAFLDVPVLFRLVERRADNRLRDFELTHTATP